ncbi:TPA: hypothetical protein DF272_02950 [Candidatus Falkowbacteria bacterium]|nr:hypothetical protein [Candidatus Falkowbacteria bacterium]
MRSYIVEIINFVINHLVVFSLGLLLLELFMPGFVIYYIDLNILLVSVISLKIGYWLYQY